jgi:flagellar biosynthesis protein FlhG
VLLVTTPEPTALVDAYAMVKVVHLRDPQKPLWLLVNNAQSHEEAQETIDQLQAATARFLGRELNVLGMLPADPYILQAVRQQQGVMELFPQAPVSQAIQAAARLLQEKIPLQKDGFAAFWKGLRDD